MFHECTNLNVYCFVLFVFSWIVMKIINGLPCLSHIPDCVQVACRPVKVREVLGRLVQRNIKPLPGLQHAQTPVIGGSVLFIVLQKDAR